MTKAGKALASFVWLPSYAWQLLRRRETNEVAHLIIAVADHFEPAFLPGARGPAAARDEQIRRVQRWCLEYPRIADPWRDSDGCPFRHTYFWPAEQYDATTIEALGAHCRDGWGEIEIHLHHGLDAPDTAENTRRILVAFRDVLAGHGCLSRWNGEGEPRYGFVHGNWALANSDRNRFCGVDNEMQILAETGCYADFTLPSAPSPTQVSKINSLYECLLPLDMSAPHRQGRDLRSGRPPTVFPLIVQGPLGLQTRWLSTPRIENGELSDANPPSLRRFGLWSRLPIRVVGRPDWMFLKLHCHGMDPRSQDAMFGGLIRLFLRDLTEFAREARLAFHFATAREMANMILAACDGQSGNPGHFRDYRLRPITRFRER